MATKIVTKSGSGAPATTDLVAGELAVDLTNKRLYTENGSAAIIEVGSNPYNFTANHDGSAKLATTATGIDVTGSVTADGLTVDDTSGTVGLFNSTGVASTLAVNNTHANAWGSNIAFRTGGTDAGYFGSIGSLLGNTDQDLTAYSTAGNGFRIYTNGNNERLRVTSAGNVGIGTTKHQVAFRWYCASGFHYSPRLYGFRDKLGNWRKRSRQVANMGRRFRFCCCIFRLHRGRHL